MSNLFFEPKTGLKSNLLKKSLVQCKTLYPKFTFNFKSPIFNLKQDGVIETRFTLPPETTKRTWQSYETMIFKRLDIRCNKGCNLWETENKCEDLCNFPRFLPWESFQALASLLKSATHLKKKIILIYTNSSSKLERKRYC